MKSRSIVLLIAAAAVFSEPAQGQILFSEHEHRSGRGTWLVDLGPQNARPLGEFRTNVERGARDYAVTAYDLPVKRMSMFTFPILPVPASYESMPMQVYCPLTDVVVTSVLPLHCPDSAVTMFFPLPTLIPISPSP